VSEKRHTAAPASRASESNRKPAFSSTRLDALRSGDLIAELDDAVPAPIAPSCSHDVMPE
jgi:hypothetical protein